MKLSAKGGCAFGAEFLTGVRNDTDLILSHSRQFHLSTIVFKSR
jgi:hypothetical protein